MQKNLVFVVGLPPRLADAEILKKHEYFGKYGKIHKVVINPSTTYAGVQGPSASAYVTYVHNNDALRAIQSVNNITIDGRSIKTSLGTTKYCSHFMKNQVCPKPDCMYLHELGDTEASFTKEEMHQGKHQEYEKRLHDSLIAQMQQQSQQTPSNPTSASPTNASTSPTNVKEKDKEMKEKDPATNEAWPSLATSPLTVEKGGKKSKENVKGKLKGDKTKGKQKQKVKTPQTISLEEELAETDDTDDTISSTTDSGTISESDSGKTSPPSSFPDPPGHNNHRDIITVTTSEEATTNDQITKLQTPNEREPIMSSSANSIIETSDITALYSNNSSEKTKENGNGSLADTSGKIDEILLDVFDTNFNLLHSAPL